jgi:hypothetical protein
MVGQSGVCGDLTNGLIWGILWAAVTRAWNACAEVRMMTERAVRLHLLTCP